MLLADAAQAAEGKLYIIGAGWNITGPAPTPSAVAVYIEVSWDLSNMKHKWRLDLLTSDGEPVMIETPVGEQPLFVEGELEVGRPVGLQPGVGLGVPLAVNLGPIPLAPDSRFEWKLTIDGKTDDNWRTPFSTRPAQPQMPQQLGPPPGQ